MKLAVILLITLLFLEVATCYTFADVVYLTNGQTYEGTVLKEDEEKIALKTSIMTIILYKENVKAIERFYPIEGSKMPEGEKFSISDVLKDSK